MRSSRIGTMSMVIVLPASSWARCPSKRKGQARSRPSRLRQKQDVAIADGRSPGRVAAEAAQDRQRLDASPVRPDEPGGVAEGGADCLGQADRIAMRTRQQLNDQCRAVAQDR